MSARAAGIRVTVAVTMFSFAQLSRHLRLDQLKMPQFSIFSGDARGSAESMGNFPRGASRNSKFLGRSEFCRDGLARTWPRTAEAKGAGGSAFQLTARLAARTRGSADFL